MNVQLYPNGFRISDTPVATSFANPHSFQPVADMMHRDEACLQSSISLGGSEGSFVPKPHPGLKAYGAGTPAAPAEPAQPETPAAPQEEIGFCLPENERTEHTWNDEPKDEADGDNQSQPTVQIQAQSPEEPAGRHRQPSQWESDDTQVIRKIADAAGDDGTDAEANKKDEA